MADEKITIGFKKSYSNSGSVLKYPKGNVYEDFTDYVRFDFYKYKPPFTTSGTGAPKVDKDGNVIDGTTNASLNRYNESSNQSELKRDEELKTILLYMPEDISTGTSIGWTGKGFTNAGAGLLRTAGPPTTGNVGGGFTNLVGELGKLVQRGPSVGAQAVASAVNNLPGGIGGDVGLQDVLGGIGGVILNPNTELMFGSFELRSFQLKFKLAPRNGGEADEIREIVNTFKKASLPSYSAAAADFWSQAAAFLSNDNNKTGDNNSNYIGVPSLCGVTFMSGSKPNEYVSQFKTSAITSVDINYTPDGAYSTYGGALGNSQKSPVAIELSLGFTETKLVYRQEISTTGATY